MDSLTGLRIYRLDYYNYLGVDKDDELIWVNSVMDKFGNSIFHNYENENVHLINSQGRSFDIEHGSVLLGNGKYVDGNNNIIIRDCKTNNIIHTFPWRPCSIYNQYAYNGKREIFNTDDYTIFQLDYDISDCILKYFDGVRAIIETPDHRRFATDRPRKSNELIYADSYGGYTILEITKQNNDWDCRFTLYMGQPVELPIIKLRDVTGLEIFDNVICFRGSHFSALNIIDNPKCTNYKIDYIYGVHKEGFNSDYAVYKIRSLNRFSKPSTKIKANEEEGCELQPEACELQSVACESAPKAP